MYAAESVPLGVNAERVVLAMDLRARQLELLPKEHRRSNQVGSPRLGAEVDTAADPRNCLALSSARARKNNRTLTKVRDVDHHRISVCQISIVVPPLLKPVVSLVVPSSVDVPEAQGPAHWRNRRSLVPPQRHTPPRDERWASGSP